MRSLTSVKKEKTLGAKGESKGPAGRIKGGRWDGMDEKARTSTEKMNTNKKKKRKKRIATAPAGTVAERDGEDGRERHKGKSCGWPAGRRREERDGGRRKRDDVGVSLNDSSKPRGV